MRLGPSPRVVPGSRGHLSAAEIQPASTIRAWLAKRRSVLEEIALRGTWLDREDVAGLLALSLPGIDELAALFEIARFVRAERYDLVVVDTAPTGHTLRMLDTPGILGGIARVFDAMQSRHRLLVATLRGRWAGDDADALIEDLDRGSRALASMLRDPKQAAALWVTLPEPMAIEETLDALGGLTARSIPIETVVVNRLTPRPVGSCSWCDPRREFEAGAIEQLDRHCRKSRIAIGMVVEREREPVGMKSLTAIARDLESVGTNTNTGRRTKPRRSLAVRTRLRTAVSRPGERTRSDPNGSELQRIQNTSVRLLMFGGKGGTGKTTCAAAAALAIAREHPHRRILLLSTDPAHSLSDALGRRVSDRPAGIGGGPAGLHVRELDAVAAFTRTREEYAAAIDALFDRLTRTTAVEASHDRRVMQGLVDLAPPGVDELMAMTEVVDTLDVARQKRAYDLIVVDTAPTGHALRLLQMPAIVQDWTRALMRILLKYQPITGVGALGESLLRLSRGLGRLRAILADPAATSFVVVTRPAELPLAETRRLLIGLRRLRIPVDSVIVNAVSTGTCPRCRRIAKAERHEISVLGMALRSSVTMTLTPAVVPPPLGPTELLRWQRQWEPARHASRGGRRRRV
jgi:arsenite-transporting ATPase